MRCNLTVFSPDPPNHYGEVIFEVVCEEIGFFTYGMEKDIVKELAKKITECCNDYCGFVPTKIVCCGDLPPLESWTTLPVGTHELELHR